MHIGYHEFTRMVPYMRKKHPIGVIRASCRSLQGPRGERRGKASRSELLARVVANPQGLANPFTERRGWAAPSPYLKLLLNPPFVKGGLEITRTRYSYLPFPRGGDSHEMQGLRDYLCFIFNGNRATASQFESHSIARRPVARWGSTSGA